MFVFEFFITVFIIIISFIIDHYKKNKYNISRIKEFLICLVMIKYIY